MEFSDDQKEVIKQWVGEGCNLAEIQRRIASEFGTTMTYMDVRFLILDLEVAIVEPEEPEPEPEDAPAPVDSAAPPPPPPPAAAPAPGDPLGGSVSVEMDRLVRPGALVSGSVVFSDGVTATWMLDQTGRLAIDASQPGYRPSEADNAAFVKTLQDEISKKGMA